MHHLLKQQLADFFGDAEQIPKELHGFVDSIDKTYQEFDQDRHKLKHSLETSAQESSQTNNEMRAMLQAFPDIIFRLDSSGKILDFQGGNRQDIGADPDKLIGHSVEDLPLGDIGQKFKQTLPLVLQYKSVESLEHRLEIKGSMQYYEARLIPILQDQAVAIVRNITNRKSLAHESQQRQRFFQRQSRVVASLSKSEKLYAGDLQAALQEITKAAGNIIIVQRTSVWLYNVNRTAIICFDLFLKDTGSHSSGLELLAVDYPAYFKALEEEFTIAAHDAHSDPRTNAFSASYLTPNGISSLLDAPIRLAGEVVGTVCLEHVGAFRHWTLEEQNLSRTIADYVALAIEASDRKHAKAERAKLEEQLRQSQKMEAIGTLAGGIAHDFNNVLTGIIGFTEMVLASLTPQDALFDDVKEIKLAGDRASDLIQQLLAFSRKQIISPKVIRLDHIIAESTKMLSRIISEDIEFDFLCGKKIWRIKADPGQINQVLINLAANARDAMPGGGKFTIEISNVVHAAPETESEDSGRHRAYPNGSEGSTLPFSPELHNSHRPQEEATSVVYSYEHPGLPFGDYVRLLVNDTGIGMDDKTKSHIFEPFFSTKEEGKGTGFGLSTVYGIVQQNKGSIAVYSKPNAGTAFEILFPRADDTIEQVVPRALAKCPQGSETILLVEDEETVRKLIHRVLARQGYKILVAEDGRIASSVFEQNRGQIDLLLTDVVMPNMNGRQLAEILVTEQPDLKVLYMSGYNEDIIAHHGVLDEGTCFIQKPFTNEKLTNKVRQVLDSAAAE